MERNDYEDSGVQVWYATSSCEEGGGPGTFVLVRCTAERNDGAAEWTHIREIRRRAWPGRLALVAIRRLLQATRKFAPIILHVDDERAARVFDTSEDWALDAYGGRNQDMILALRRDASRRPTFEVRYASQGKGMDLAKRLSREVRTPAG